VRTRVTLDNVTKVLETAGTFNTVFREYFEGVQPARTTWPCEVSDASARAER